MCSALISHVKQGSFCRMLALTCSRWGFSNGERQTDRLGVWVGPPSQSAGPICCPARVWQITLLLLVITLYGDHCNLWCRGLSSRVSFIMVPVWPQSMSSHHSLSAPKVTNKTEKCDVLFSSLSGTIWYCRNLIPIFGVIFNGYVVVTDSVQFYGDRQREVIVTYWNYWLESPSFESRDI
jgi:hypothetical protein